jgi:cyclic-di-GMP-binding protein
MPSFDITSKVDTHELTNAIDQANREVSNRFDFKDSNAKFIFTTDEINLVAQNKFQLQQMMDILELKLSKRKIDPRCLKIDEPKESLHEAKQKITIKTGIDTEMGKKIVKIIKDSKLKVQAAIQDNQVRVTGNKRDDLQTVIAMLRQQHLDIPLQYENFRD